MAMYKKKPVVIEARQRTNSNSKSLAKWCSGSLYSDNRLTIDTLEGAMEISMGDYIIKGIHGEFYPCKPDIFEASYDYYGIA